MPIIHTITGILLIFADDIRFLDDMLLLQYLISFLPRYPRPLCPSIPNSRLSHMIIDTNWQRTQLHRSVIYPTCERNNSLSLLINACASSILVNKSASPMTRAASRTSRQVSSNLVITLTMVPSGISVN